ncbi:MAG: ribonuclease H-like domain-containing protein [Nanoarchaeota archaeon]|nr:ribonuclease H-like domain-containing protein [Nanoarchaeota archaeon]
MLIVENKANKIEIFGRNQLGKPYIKIDNSFKPYFYIKNSRGEFKTIDGERVSKVICENPKEIPEKRKKYEHYEGDIVYTNRYIIDRVDKINKEPIRVCHLDIEIEQADGYSDPNKATNKITLIGCYDSFNKKYKQFILKDFEKRGDNEAFMLSSFIEYIQETNPDIISAWYGNGFDFPYLLTRMKNLKIDINRLSRNNGYSYIFNNKCKIYGRILFDMLEAYKKHFSSGGRESWSLDYISKYELGEQGGKIEYEGNLDDLYKEDYSKFVKYNERDVELLVLLDNHLKMIDFFDEIRRVAFCKFEDVFMNSKTADCLCLKYAKKHGFILPSIKRQTGDKYEGGYVMKCNPKLYENIVVMDFKSLYPSIMIGFNTSYETLVKDGEIKIDHYSFKKEMGMIPSICKPLLDKRYAVKKKMQEIDKRTLEYKSLDLTQKSLKIMVNSFYGVLGFRNFRLYKREVAGAITYIARKIIKEAIKWFENRGYEVIYGDTDSIFIQFKDIDINNIKQINKEINEYFNQFIESFGVSKENNIFDLEFEEVFSVLFFKRKADGEGAKKKYAGKIIWKNGFTTKEIAIVGFESRRSDVPQVGRDFMKKVLEMVLDKVLPEKVVKYVDDFKEKIKNEFTPEQIGLPVGINKPLEDYGNVIHIRASRLANKKHNEGIRVGDKIKYIYIKGEDNVIAFKKKMPKGYEIDYDQMIRRLVDLKIEPIFSSLNWTYTYTQKEQKSHPKPLKSLKNGILGENLAKWMK